MSVTWIEASAGTGKTYTLVQTVVNLIRDRGLSVDQILMVTFTEKATEELKTRIRSGLRQGWKDSGDPKLSQALEDLPSLTVATIHGFCRTLLGQFPLESGVSFEPEMVDQDRQWRKQLRDGLRPQLAALDAGLLAWAELEDEEDLLALARQALDRNLFSLPIDHPDSQEQALFEDYRTQLEQQAGPLWEALNSGQGLNLPEDSIQGLGPDTITRHLHSSWHKKPYRVLRALLTAKTFRDLIPFLTADALESLKKWEEGTTIWKKNVEDPLPPFLERLRTVAAGFSAAVETWAAPLPEGTDLALFLAGCARYRVLADLCVPILNQRSTRELTFHDLIDRVRRLVTIPGSGLAAAAAARWKVVLIDEFQDTDSEQWDIFSALFYDADHELILVGDPKQSIYRFRGADLNVYRRVRDQLATAGARRLILEENFRSTEAMISAVNHVFDPAQGSPWEHPEDFHFSRKGQKAIPALVKKQGDGTLVPVAPLEAFQPSSEQSWHRHLTRTVLELLDGLHFLDDGKTVTALEPGDFLVLVRRKREAWTLYRHFTAHGIPATVGGSGGLLGGREAQEVLLFLKALESPRSLSAVRALGWTRLFAGGTFEVLAQALDEAQEDRNRGAFLGAFRRVAGALEPGVTDGGGLERLLRLPGGARIVTNTEHVLELVQERHHRGLVPPGQAALSLETWIQSGLQEDEVDLRRDGESHTLRLMTVHSAKGLEAPIVLHGHQSENKKNSAFWLIDDGVDFLNTKAGLLAEAVHRQSEELRLRYVAMTRARTYQVYQDPAASLAVPELSAEQGRAVGRFQGGAQSQTSPIELHHPIKGLENRHPWVESHSGLWRRAARGEAEIHTVWDRPRVRREEEGSSPESGITETLPAGPAFGDLVHDILEDADFRGWDPDAAAELRQGVTQIVETHCQRHRVDFHGRDLTQVLNQWLGRALHHRFPLGTAAEPVPMTALPPEDTRRELEFHLPLAFEETRFFDWGDRRFTVHRGFLTGRIDLLFRWQGRLYLADWKTNRLVPGQDLEEVMAEAGYNLQAQWYWEALKRLCKIQGEPLEPGGVLYVFLRGAGEGPEGVFRSPEELNQVTTLNPFLKETARG